MKFLHRGAAALVLATGMILVAPVLPRPFFGSFSGPLAAQERPYDADMLRLAEFLGALTHLESICGEPMSPSRADMQALLDAEQPDPQRRGLLVERYNRSFRSVAATHRVCTSASRALANSYRDQGSALARTILNRFGS